MKFMESGSNRLFCSPRARGEPRPDSDYDVAVFLNESDSFWTESGRISEIETDILLQREPSSTLYPSGLEPIATALPLCMRCGAKVLTCDARGTRLPQ
jgi:hypothetical protein